MKWIKRKLFERRKRSKIKLTFRGDDCIKIIIPGEYGVASGQIMDNLMFEYGFIKPIGALGGGIFL